MKNQNLQKLITELKKTSIEQKVNLWKRIALELEGPTSKKRVVNLSKINKYSNKDEVVIVPGKVLSMGELDKKITIAAHKFSQTAFEKINSSGSKALTIEELLKENPKGAKVRIIG